MTSRSTNSKNPAKGDIQVTPEEGKIKSAVVETKSLEPLDLEVDSPSADPSPAPEPTSAEKIQTDVRERLSNKSVEENIFVPSNPAALEKAAGEVAKEQGFEINRGTSIGARLMARAQKRS